VFGAERRAREEGGKEKREERRKKGDGRWKKKLPSAKCKMKKYPRERRFVFCSALSASRSAIK
jgi:hypothetical protein